MDESAPSDFAPRELYLYACGQLDAKRADEIRSAASKDADLSAKIAFFGLFVDEDTYAGSIQILNYMGAWARMAEIAAFGGFWSIAFAAYVHPIVAIIYGAIEFLILILDLIRRRSGATGTLWEAVLGALYVGAIPLIPAFLLGRPITTSIGTAVVVLGFIGSNIGMRRGFGLTQRVVSREVSAVDVVVQTLILWFVNFMPAFMIVGFLMLGASLLGFKTEEQYSDSYVEEWSLLLSFLPAGARAITPNAVRCNVWQWCGPIIVGGLFYAVSYLVLCYMFTLPVEGYLVSGLFILGSSMGGRTTVYKGFDPWWAEKRELLSDTAHLLVAFGIAFSFTFAIHHVFRPFSERGFIAKDLFEPLVLLTFVLSFLALEFRWYRFLLPRVSRSKLATRQSSLEAYRAGAARVLDIPRAVALAIYQLLSEVATFYRLILSEAMSLSPVVARS